MSARRRVWIASLTFAVVGGSLPFTLLVAPRVWPAASFIVGGGLIDLGYRLQDPFEEEHEERHEELTPQGVWTSLLDHNRLAATVRARFPRTVHHPLAAILVCMDARIDTLELMGDSRKYYYVLRTAGSVLEEAEEEMLELAVENGVKVILLTTHTDCAAEKMAAGPERSHFMQLAEAVEHRSLHIEEFLARKPIAEKIANGELLVKRAQVDTETGELTPRE